jgi:hypothetical protein
VWLSAFLILCGTALLADAADGSSDSCVYYQEVAAGQSFDALSPNYPYRYPNGIDCRWEAIAPSTSHFILDCTVFSIPKVSEIRFIFAPFRSNWPIFAFNLSLQQFPHFPGIFKYYSNTLPVSQNIIIMRSRSSSVSIVSYYGLDDRGSIPDRGRGFSSSLCVHTGSWARQPPVQWVPGVLSPEVKHGRGVTLTSHPI